MALHVMDEANQCLQCKKPRCQEGCPIHTNIPEVIRLLKEGQLDEAGWMLFENNPLTTVCSLICNHENQCEGHCVRGIKGSPVHFSVIENYVSSTYASQMTKGPAPKNGMRVAIIGAGNAAMDVARTAMRHGAHHITCFSLTKKVTASDYEVSYAKLEGIEFRYNKKPLEIFEDGVVFCDLEEAEDGTLTEIPGTEVKYPADSTIISISQGPCTTITDSTTGLQVNPRGLFVTNEVGETTRPGVFASGDAVKGARTVVEAVAYSKKVAEAMHEYMQSLPKDDTVSPYADVPLARD